MPWSILLISAVIGYISAVKVIDLIQFNGDILVNLRFIYLFDVVDKFVVVEGAYGYNGVRKEALFMDIHADWFEKLSKSNKLLKFVVTDFPPMNHTPHHSQHSMNSQNYETIAAYKRESFQRDYAVSKILEFYQNESFMLISCDADEIPRREVLLQLKSKEYYEEYSSGAYLDMGYFYYNFRWIKNSKWQRAIAIGDSLLRKTVKENITLHELRMLGQFTVIMNAGWHCSYCTSAEKIRHKLTHSVAHMESNSLSHHHSPPHMIANNLTWINHCIDEGIDLFERKESHEILKPYDGRLGYPNISEFVMIDALRYLQKRFNDNGTFLGFGT